MTHTPAATPNDPHEGPTALAAGHERHRHALPEDVDSRLLDIVLNRVLCDLAADEKHLRLVYGVIRAMALEESQHVSHDMRTFHVDRHVRALDQLLENAAAANDPPVPTFTYRADDAPAPV